MIRSEVRIPLTLMVGAPGAYSLHFPSLEKGIAENPSVVGRAMPTGVDIGEVPMVVKTQCTTMGKKTLAID